MRDIGITKSSRYRVLKWDIRLRRAKVYFAGEKGKGTKASYTEFLDEQGAELVEKLTDNPNVIVVGAKVGIPDEVITYVSGGTKEVDEFIINEDQLVDLLDSKSERYWGRAIVYFHEDAMEAKYEDQLMALDAEIVDQLTDGPNLIVLKGKRDKLSKSVLEYISENRGKIILWGEDDFNDALTRMYDEHTDPAALARSRPLKPEELDGARVLYTSLNKMQYESAVRILTEEFGVKKVANQLIHGNSVTGRQVINNAATYDFMVWGGKEREATIVLKYAILANKLHGKPEIIRGEDFLNALREGGWSEDYADGVQIKELEGPKSAKRGITDYDMYDNELPHNVGIHIIPSLFMKAQRDQFYKYMKTRGIQYIETLPDDVDDMPQLVIVKYDDEDKLSAKDREYISQIPGANLMGQDEFFELLYKRHARNYMTAIDPDFDWRDLKGKNVVYMLGNTLGHKKYVEKLLYDNFGVRNVTAQLQDRYTGKRQPIFCIFVDPQRDKWANYGLAAAYGIPLINKATLEQAFVEVVPGYNKNKNTGRDTRLPEGRPPQTQLEGGTRDIKGLADDDRPTNRKKRPDPYRRTRDLAPAPGARNRSRGRSGLAGEVNNPPTRRRALN